MHYGANHKYIPALSLLLAVREQTKRDEAQWRRGKFKKRFIISPLKEWRNSSCRILLKVCVSLCRESMYDNISYIREIIKNEEEYNE